MKRVIIIFLLIASITSLSIGIIKVKAYYDDKKNLTDRKAIIEIENKINEKKKELDNKKEELEKEKNTKKEELNEVEKWQKKVEQIVSYL